MIRKLFMMVIVFLVVFFMSNCTLSHVPDIVDKKTTEKSLSYKTVDIRFLYANEPQSQSINIPSEVCDFTQNPYKVMPLVDGLVAVFIYPMQQDNTIINLVIAAPQKIAPKILILGLAIEYNDKSKNKCWIYEKSIPVISTIDGLIEVVNDFVARSQGTSL